MRRSACLVISTLFFLSGLTMSTPAARPDDDDAPAPTRDVLEPPPFDDFVIIPLRVHLLQSEDVADLNCELTDADVRRVLGKVNRIWNVAGIHWGLESIVREPAEGIDAFKAAREASPDGRAPLNVFRTVRPQESRSFDGLHVYYIRRFSVNGVYLGSDFAFVQDTARLREVEGGIDEPIPRVTAHELGHALGLPHRQDRTNLLASGTTGTKLNSKEVETARAKALKQRGAARAADLARDAETAPPERAKLLKTWLEQVPRNGNGEDAPVDRPESSARD
jgi:hypothetical protein